MDTESFLPDKLDSELGKNILLVASSLALIGVSAGVHNLTTPEEPMRVGLVEIETECLGFEAGFCLGLERQNHETYNYANYTEAEPGEPNYYRRVESELMAQAYNICEAENVTEYEWTSEAEYDNRTGSEWRGMDEIQLLPCEETFYRRLNATS
ncbi:MAG: hypothetical protein ABEK10_04200 [Candidatus Nanosalina sp.]